MRTDNLLLKNIFNLSILHAVNYLLPIITIPYLIRVLGTTNYGLVVMASSLMGVLIIINDYGFNYTATKSISVNRNNKIQIDAIFNSVMGVKYLLLIFLSITLLILSSLIQTLSDNWLLYVYTFGMVIGSTLYPIWYFQGIEKMKFITLIDLFSKGVSTILIFTIIKKPEDYLLVPLLTSSSYLLSGTISMVIIRKTFKVRYYIPNWKEIRKQLSEGWHVFNSSFFNSLFAIGTPFIVGMFSDGNMVTYFSIPQKIIKAVRKIYAPIAQALFPNISLRFQKDEAQSLNFVIKLLKYLSISMFIICSIIFATSEIIIELVTGEVLLEAIIILRILSIVPVFFVTGNILGIQTMLNIGMEKNYSTIVSFVSISGLLLLLLLTWKYSGYGASIAILSTEITLTILIILKIRKKIIS